MSLKLASYNLHGYNQGQHLLTDLCPLFDVLFIQEHWLYPDELHYLNNIDCNYLFVGTSSMINIGARVRQGRPFGGLGILIKRDLLANFICVAKRERFIAVFVANILFINVYMPVYNGVEYEDEMQCILTDIMSIISENCASNVVIGGDFNFNFEPNHKVTNLFHHVTGDKFVFCDNFLTSVSSGPPVTFRRNELHAGTFIDHFCVTRPMRDTVEHVYIIDRGDNLSDHLPICMDLRHINTQGDQFGISDRTSNCRRLRWDKADLSMYYQLTYFNLSSIPVIDDMWDCQQGDQSKAQDCVNYIHDNIVLALAAAANTSVPRTKSDYFKSWWNEALSDLKRASQDAHVLWVSCGRPRQGDIFLEMHRHKIAYKRAVRTYKAEGDKCMSNELHELLLDKDITGFWHSWNAKMGRQKVSAVIEGSVDDAVIANLFAAKFSSHCKAREEPNLHTLSGISHADDDIALEIQTVDNCISKLKKNKAPGVDGIEPEHLSHAHPIVVMQLCTLFNIMLRHAVVPTAFLHGIVIPVIKNKRGDTTVTDNYRPITLSTCLSKLFELCIIELYGNKMITSPLQFGFKKKLGTMHAMYVLNNTVQYFVNSGSTVNVALLDISKAFDTVDHNMLIKRLVDIGLPPNVVLLLSKWYSGCMAWVRWGTCFSRAYNVTSGVRQGGILSPLLFNVYMNVVIERLEQSGLGCRIGTQYIGCIMYADDLLLLSTSTVCLQNMVNLCVSEVTSNLKMSFNATKSCILRFGPRVGNRCTSVCINDTDIPYVDRAKYLGVMLQSAKKFKVDIKFNKTNFYSKFNSIFHKAAKLKNELVMTHLISTFCKPYLLYCTEAVSLTITEERSLDHTWNTALSHIFHLSGRDVNYISNYVENASLLDTIISRRNKFVNSLPSIQNDVIQVLCQYYACRVA